MSVSDVVSVRIDGELKQRLRKLSRSTGRSESFYVREALAQQIADLEDGYLALDALEKIRAGGPTYTHAEVMAELELDD